MKFLVYGDLHLKPAGSGYDLEQLTVPPDIDAALVLGDLTHRAGEDDQALAAEFVSQFEPDLPVVYVPGNHDHTPTEHQVVDSIPEAYSGHKAVHRFDQVSVVGWGCESRTLDYSLDQTAYEALSLEGVSKDRRRYRANQIADEVEAACYDVICGSGSIAEAVDALGIARAEEATFRDEMAGIADAYEQLTELLEGQEHALLATHVPPYNVSFDRHHAVGDRQQELEFAHVGSIAIKLAIRTHDVFGALSGHSHCYGYDVESHDETHSPIHYLNLGFRGIATLRVSPETDEFVFKRADIE